VELTIKLAYITLQVGIHNAAPVQPKIDLAAAVRREELAREIELESDRHRQRYYLIP
jgi:hypothetical protein